MPSRDLMPALWHSLQAHMAADPAYKVIVFFTTARSAQFYANMMRAAGQPVRRACVVCCVVCVLVTLWESSLHV